jgi:hypothetical protein
LYKAVDGVQSQWSKAAYSIFWADHITVQRRMGCSPYFAATGTHPILPLDIAEATYLLPPPTELLSTTELIATKAIALQKRKSHLSTLQSKVMATLVQAAIQFEREHAVTIRYFDFKRGDLVLIRNTAIEKGFNRKMRSRYLGPLVVISRNKGHAYILCELNGSVFDAFRVIPYFAHKAIALPDLSDFLDITTDKLRKMEEAASLGDDDDQDDQIGPDVDSLLDATSPATDPDSNN